MSDFTDRQKEIIDVSIQLIAKGGIQELTIKNISESIGFSEPAVYRHFDSKMDILLGILSYFKDNLKSTTPERSAIKSIESIFLRHFQNFTDNPAIAAIIFSEEIFQNDKRLSDEVFSILEHSRAQILSIIEDGQESGEIRNDISKEQLSLVIQGALRLIVTRWRLSGLAFELQTEGVALWESLRTIIQITERV